MVLPISDYEKLLEDLEDLAVVAERRDEPASTTRAVRRRFEAGWPRPPKSETLEFVFFACFADVAACLPLGFQHLSISTFQRFASLFPNLCESVFIRG